MPRTDPDRCAAQLSFWLPGLGQLYRGRWLSGVAFLAASWWLTDAALAAWPRTPWCAVATAVLALAVWIAAVSEAERNPQMNTENHRETRRPTAALGGFRALRGSLCSSVANPPHGSRLTSSPVSKSRRR
jgi:hypothetical protein